MCVGEIYRVHGRGGADQKLPSVNKENYIKGKFEKGWLRSARIAFGRRTQDRPTPRRVRADAAKFIAGS